MDCYQTSPLLEAFHSLRTVMKQLAKDKQIHQNEVHILMFIEEKQQIRIQEIGEHFGVTKPRATAIVSSLLDKAYIHVSVSEQDKRQKLLTLTAKGKAYVTQEKIAFEKTLAEIWQQFDSSEQEQFVHLSQKLTQVLSELHQKGLKK